MFESGGRRHARVVFVLGNKAERPTGSEGPKPDTTEGTHMVSQTSKTIQYACFGARSRTLNPHPNALFVLHGSPLCPPNAFRKLSCTCTRCVRAHIFCCCGNRNRFAATQLALRLVDKRPAEVAALLVSGLRLQLASTAALQLISDISVRDMEVFAQNHCYMR